ncbi:hypothetical protein BGZ75_003954 [Mortierella antarctica]|nr:hypothetical protein BGZ75_003954 [Mortierella antarctica]
MDVIWLYRAKTTDTPDLDAIIKVASIARFSQTPRAKIIKPLRLPSYSGGYENPLPLLRLKSHVLDLDTCEIPGFSADEDIRDIELVVREHCPNLKWERKDGQAARAFIRGCSGIQTFTSHLFSDYDAENWDTSDDDDDEFEPRHIISESVSRHDSTLEVFELTESFQVFSHVQQEILSRCTKLKRFWVTCSESKTNMGAIMSRHISTGDWVCI